MRTVCWYTGDRVENVPARMPGDNDLWGNCVYVKILAHRLEAAHDH